jgi:hypothetical protein
MTATIGDLITPTGRLVLPPGADRAQHHRHRPTERETTMTENRIWAYAMDAALHCVRRDRTRYRVYGYLSPWGGWAYTIAPADQPVPADRRYERLPH